MKNKTSYNQQILILKTPIYTDQQLQLKLIPLLLKLIRIITTNKTATTIKNTQQ